ncbi:alpha/beta fold hydrolase [Ferrimonas gelatinilytica]|uniref:Alpha/beta fold hydrolase n=1 Tax=Ferrimonas gelatinilytica TaxID=1255257 RepID=A0ABP9RW55_9GAMM
MTLDQLMAGCPLWRQTEQGRLIGVDGIPLSFGILRHPDARGAVVISNGRVESYLKYWPWVQWLHRQGFSVYLWDHRGQGLSGRMLSNPHIGHVERFDDYIEDMARFYQQKVLPDGHRHHYLLGHSMGGAIGALYLERHPDHFERALFTAPMFGIRLPVPRALIKPVSAVLTALKPHHYVPGGHDYDPVPFEANELTTDRREYEQFRQLYRDWPPLQLGDPSNQWLQQALRATERLGRAEIVTPLKILQAQQDTIVSNVAHHAFCQRQSQHQLHTLDGRHELLIEAQAVRKQVQRHLLEWFR